MSTSRTLRTTSAATVLAIVTLGFAGGPAFADKGGSNSGRDGGEDRPSSSVVNVASSAKPTITVATNTAATVPGASTPTTAVRRDDDDDSPDRGSDDQTNHDADDDVPRTSVLGSISPSSTTPT